MQCLVTQISCNIYKLFYFVSHLCHTFFCLQITWFSKTYFKEMVQHFLPYFPYAMHEKPRQTKAGQGSKVKGQKEVLPQISVFTLNLSVCKVSN